MPRKMIDSERRITKSISITPKLWKSIQDLAESRGQSPSDLICAAMAKIVNKNADVTKQFKETQANFEKVKQAARDAALMDAD